MAVALTLGLVLPAPWARADYRLALDGGLGLRSVGGSAAAGGAVDARGDRELGTASIALRFDAVRPRLELGLIYEPTFQRLLQGAGDGATQHSLAAALAADLGRRTTLRVAERFRQGEEPELGFVVAPEAVIVTERGEQRHQALELAVRHQASRLWSWEVDAEQRAVRFTAADLPGGDALGVGAGLTRAIGRGGEMGLRLAARRADLERRGETDTLQAAFSASRPLGRSGRLTADLGAYRAELTTAGGASRAASGPYGGLALAGSLRRIGWRAEARRDVGNGLALGAPTASDRALVGATVAAGRRLTLATTAAYTRDRALAGGAEALDVLAARVEAAWRLGGRASLAMGATWLDQSSTFPGLGDLDFARYHVGLRVRLATRGDDAMAPSQATAGLWEAPAPAGFEPAAALGEAAP